MDQLTDSTDLNAILATAPGNPLIWKRFLTDLARQLNCDSSFLLITDISERENTHFLYSANIPQEYQERYENQLNKLDAFNYFICKNPLQVYCNQTLENTDLEEVKGDFIPPGSQNYRFGISIPCNHNFSLSLLVSRKNAFKREERHQAKRILQNIVPTLEESLHEEQRHKIDSQLIHNINDHFDGYIVIDSELNILFSDPLYTSIISQLDCVKISENKFGMKNPVINQRLMSLVENNQETASIHNQCQSCQITLIPISSLQNLYRWECYKNGFIITFTHNKEKNPTITRLTEIYKLSHCEAVCSLHFMKTPSIPEVAKNTFRSQETVRNHIKHAMQKMNVHNQAEMMKKLLTLSTL